MSTVIPQPESSLEEIVREDVYSALIDQGFKRDQAENASRCATGVTFSEVFKSALEWANNARRGFHVVPKQSQPTPKPKKEAPMQAQTAAVKTNGHAPATLRTCKCGCGENVPAENRFAYIQGHLKRAKPPVSTEKCHCGRPLGHTGKHVGGKVAPAKPARVVSVAPPRFYPRLARSHRSPTQSISGEALARRQAATRQLFSAIRRVIFVASVRA